MIPRPAARNLTFTLMLLGITAIWGWTFLIVKDAVARYPVLDFLALRFLLAALILAPLAVRGFSKRTIGIGLGVGGVVAAAYLFQTAGLTRTSAANAGLLTGLFVILTPIFDRLFYHARLSPVTLMATVMGFTGTALLVLTGATGPNAGDLLEILTAVCFAFQVVWLGHHTAGQSSMQLAFGQMAPGAVIFTVLAAGTSTDHVRWPTPSVWFAIVITALLASALAFWVQTFVQQRLPPSRVALILLGEPAFATLFAAWLGGERLSALQWLGAALIFGSLLCHELWMARLSRAASVAG